MKYLSIILLTFAIALLTSLLLDLAFIQNQIIRVVIVHVLIVFEFVVGFFYLKKEIK